MDLPETRYARSGEFSVAYQAVGEGPFDLVWIPSFAHHVELSWENPPIASFLRRLASICRLIVFDKRGTGMSDRVVGLPTLETRMDDIRAVMDAAGSDRAVVMGLGDAGPALRPVRGHLSGENIGTGAGQLVAASNPVGRSSVASGPRRGRAAARRTQPPLGRTGLHGRVHPPLESGHEQSGAPGFGASRTSKHEPAGGG